MIRRLFRRRPAPAPALSEAELAHRLTDPDYACPRTGQVLRAAEGAVQPIAPFGWKFPPEPDPDEKFDLGGPECFTENYARRDGVNLLRALLPIPVLGTEAQAFLGVWCSLPTGNHAWFRSAQARGDAHTLGEMPSWLYTQLPALTGPVLTEGILVPYPEGRQPLYWISTPKHPFFAAQQEGMRAAEILALYDSLGAGDLVAQLKA